MSFLELIHSPADLRKLRQSDLKPLTDEVRERILSVVSESGGHLAPSLGAVDLAVALHYVYNTPTDKIVWDVGHQAYAHKILTGRNSRFHTIRQHGGLSGFPRVEESEYDCISVGHASTSISSALGMAVARDLKKENHHVVAVIGDGSMTGGLAYEGLNNAGAHRTNLTVILNDNSMSISKNVGAISNYLTRVIVDPRYNKLKKDLWELTGKFSTVGSGIRKIVASIDESIKHLVIPGKLFEDLGFRYFGLVDGHNLTELIDVLRNVRAGAPGPVLIHIQTKKGKGCEYAEQDSTKFHGIGSFERSSGKVQKHPGSVPTYTEVFSRALVAQGHANPSLVAITAAMPDGTGLRAFGEAFPQRFFDVGIAESHAVTFAAGMAAHGMRPVVAIYSTFLQRSFDQIIHDVALSRFPVIFCLDRAGLVGDDGPTHHGYFDLTYLRMIPHVIVMAPKDEAELCHMLQTAMEYKDGPVCIRYPRGAGMGVEIPSRPEAMEIGEPEVLCEGGDVTVLAIGDMVGLAQDAADLLAKEHHIKAGVVNARFAKPLGAGFERLLKSAKRVVTLESNTIVGGFGSAICEAAQALSLKTQILTLGYPDRFVEHGTKALLLDDLGLSPQKIAARTATWLKT